MYPHYTLFIYCLFIGGYFQCGLVVSAITVRNHGIRKAISLHQSEIGFLIY